MIDPMADIGSGFDPTKSNGSGEGGGTEILNFHALQLNHRKIDYVQSFMGIVSGCVAGICRFTGLEGLGKRNFFPPRFENAVYLFNDIFSTLPLCYSLLSGPASCGNAGIIEQNEFPIKILQPKEYYCIFDQ